MITIRQASADDEALYLRWANDPVVRENAFSSDPITAQEHAAWFRSRLASTDSLLYVLELGGNPIAQVRFDVQGGRAAVDYSVDAEYRGQGFGKRALQMAVVELYSRAEFGHLTIEALVKKGNDASARAFLWMGFTEKPGEVHNVYTFSRAQLVIPFVVLVSKPANYVQMYRRLSELFGPRVLFVVRSLELQEAKLSLLAPRVLFFVHWSQMIPASVFERYTSIVFHMTDLPFGRGGSPLQNLIARGFKETVISALAVEQGLDTGPVYARVPLSLEGSAREIFERAGIAIAELIERFADDLPEPVPQQGIGEVFKRRTPADSSLHLLESPAQVFDQIRMVDADGYPRAFLETEHLRFEFDGAMLRGEVVEAHVRIFKK